MKKECSNRLRIETFWKENPGERESASQICPERSGMGNFKGKWEGERFRKCEEEAKRTAMEGEEPYAVCRRGGFLEGK